ncbi:hypothetical protein L228DRAFT_66478 [Xylona heveae TC161]|uniref:Uncharacterized protein n=1 Tax=Xylona heveae (strain CBS 132557 / TC161) TaxID=1328760 RepID=A0A165ISE7_XYLHT|nr:hypothetical protein L228DRAFT_66478 [Xylona heveae TC161]KZF25318.1 hypothetical protein L228DRAFT_66478 [Xylona heveae TC161]
MSLASLRINSLYIVMHTKEVEFADIPGPLQWSMYLHLDGRTGGMRYRIECARGNSIANHGHTAAILKSIGLIGLIRIANLPDGLEIPNLVDSIMRGFDSQLNTLQLDSRTWTFRLLELLQQPLSGHTILVCNNLEALRQEAEAWGRSNVMDAENNIQPRPIHDSTHCRL